MEFILPLSLFLLSRFTHRHLKRSTLVTTAWQMRAFMSWRRDWSETAQSSAWDSSVPNWTVKVQNIWYLLMCPLCFNLLLTVFAMCDFLRVLCYGPETCITRWSLLTKISKRTSNYYGKNKQTNKQTKSNKIPKDKQTLKICAVLQHELCVVALSVNTQKIAIRELTASVIPVQVLLLCRRSWQTVRLCWGWIYVRMTCTWAAWWPWLSHSRSTRLLLGSTWTRNSRRSRSVTC